MENARLRRLAAILVAVCVVLLSTQVRSGECLSNATRVADDVMGAEEFLMESETARRIMAQARPPLPQSKRSLYRGKGYCDANIYSNCDPKLNKIYEQRKCGYDGCLRVKPPIMG